MKFTNWKQNRKWTGWGVYEFNFRKYKGIQEAILMFRLVREGKLKKNKYGICGSGSLWQYKFHTWNLKNVRSKIQGKTNYFF